MLLRFNKAKHQSTMKYMETWFWSFETLAKASNLSAGALSQMLQAGCAPGLSMRLIKTMVGGMHLQHIWEICPYLPVKMRKFGILQLPFGGCVAQHCC